MATISKSNPTFFDLAAMPSNKDSADVINLLAKATPELTDAVVLPCNKGLYHETRVLVGLPTTVWGRMYKGIPTSKAARQMVKDTTGFLTSAAEVDTRIVDDIEKAMDKASVREEEAKAHLEVMGQDAGKAIFYSNQATDPDQITGFMPRFSDPTAENGKQLINGGGTGSDNASIMLISWDKETCHLIYPSKGQAGLQRKNRGAVPTLDEAGMKYFVYREEFTWHLGLTIRDWRYVVRICNIDISNLTIDGATGANLINLMTDAYYRHYGRRVQRGRTYFYMPTTIVKYLDYQARNTPKNLFLMFDQTGVNASEVLKFRTIPIRETDSLLETEVAVTGF